MARRFFSSGDLNRLIAFDRFDWIVGQSYQQINWDIAGRVLDRCGPQGRFHHNPVFNRLRLLSKITENLEYSQCRIEVLEKIASSDLNPILGGLLDLLSNDFEDLSYVSKLSMAYSGKIDGIPRLPQDASDRLIELADLVKLSKTGHAEDNPSHGLIFLSRNWEFFAKAAEALHIKNMFRDGRQREATAYIEKHQQERPHLVSLLISEASNYLFTNESHSLDPFLAGKIEHSWAKKRPSLLPVAYLSLIRINQKTPIVSSSEIMEAFTDLLAGVDAQSLGYLVNAFERQGDLAFALTLVNHMIKMGFPLGEEVSGLISSAAKQGLRAHGSRLVKFVYSLDNWANSSGQIVEFHLSTGDIEAAAEVLDRISRTRHASAGDAFAQFMIYYLQNNENEKARKLLERAMILEVQQTRQLTLAVVEYSRRTGDLYPCLECLRSSNQPIDEEVRACILETIRSLPGTVEGDNMRMMTELISFYESQFGPISMELVLPYTQTAIKFKDVVFLNLVVPRILDSRTDLSFLSIEQLEDLLMIYLEHNQWMLARIYFAFEFTDERHLSHQAYSAIYKRFMRSGERPHAGMALIRKMSGDIVKYNIPRTPELIADVMGALSIHGRGSAHAIQFLNDSLDFLEAEGVEIPQEVLENIVMVLVVLGRKKRIYELLERLEKAGKITMYQRQIYLTWSAS